MGGHVYLVLVITLGIKEGQCKWIFCVVGSESSYKAGIYWVIMFESNGNCLNQRIYVQIPLDHIIAVTIMDILHLRGDRLGQIGWRREVVKNKEESTKNT